MAAFAHFQDSADIQKRSPDSYCTFNAAVCDDGVHAAIHAPQPRFHLAGCGDGVNLALENV